MVNFYLKKLCEIVDDWRISDLGGVDQDPGPTIDNKKKPDPSVRPVSDRHVKGDPETTLEKNISGSDPR